MNNLHSKDVPTRDEAKGEGIDQLSKNMQDLKNAIDEVKKIEAAPETNQKILAAKEKEITTLLVDIVALKNATPGTGRIGEELTALILQNNLHIGEVLLKNWPVNG